MQLGANLFVLIVSLLMVFGAKAEQFGFTLEFLISEETIFALLFVLVNLLIWRIIEEIKQKLLSILNVGSIAFSAFVYCLLIFAKKFYVRVSFGIIACILLVGVGIAESVIILRHAKHQDAVVQSDGELKNPIDSLSHDNNDL